MEILAVIAVVAILVWGGVYAQRGSLVYGCLAFVIVQLCFGREFFRFEMGPVPMTLDRVLFAALVIVYVVQRRLRLTDPKPAAWPDAAMALLAVLLVWSTFSHNWEVDVPGKVSPVWRLVAGFLMPMCVYWMVRQSRIDQSTITTTCLVLALIGVYLAVTALAETSRQWWLVVPPYIADPKAGIHFGRARGPMLHSQSLGLYLDACLLCLWMLRPHMNRVGKLLLVLLIPLFLAAIIATSTRCVWIGAGLCALVVLGLPMSNRWRAAFLVAALAMAAFVAVFQWENLIRIEREGGAQASESSVNTRVSYAYVSWKMFLDAPMFGVGYGQFQQTAPAYLSDRTTSLNLEELRSQSNHNMFLAMLTETGLVGFALFVAILVGWGIGAWRVWRNLESPDWIRQQGLLMLGMLGIIFGPMLFFDLTFSPQDQTLTYLLAGLTCGLAAKRPTISLGYTREVTI